MLERIKTAKYIICACFLLIMMCLAIDSNDVQEFQADKFLLINKENSVWQFNDSKIARIDELQSAGQFLGGPFVNLYRGEYNISIQYDTDTNNNYLEIFSEDTKKPVAELSDEDKVLSLNSNEKVIHLNLKENCQLLNVKVYYSGTGFLEIKSMKIIRSVQYKDKYIYIAAIVIFMILCIVFNIHQRVQTYVHTKNKYKTASFVCLAICSMVVSYPLLNNYLLSGHDITFHLTRIEGIKDGLLAGQVPVRIHPTFLNEYGYAAGIMYPDLFLYIPALLRLLDISLVTSYQIFCFLINVTTAFVAYFSFSRISKSNFIGLTGAVMYTFAWYRLCNLYTRAAIGEVTAMAFLPLFFLGLYHLVYGDYKKWPYACLGFTCILQSHILSVFLICVISAFLVILFYKKICKIERTKAILKMIVMSILLNAWFLIPFLSFYHLDLNVKNSFSLVQIYALNIVQLFNVVYLPSPQWLSMNNEIINFTMSLKLGAAVLLASLLFVVTAKRKTLWRNKLGWFCLVIGALSAYATTDLFPWHIITSIPIIGNSFTKIQFPWRFLSIVDVFLCLVGAIGVVNFAKYCTNKRFFFVGFYVFCFFSISLVLDQYCTSTPILYKSESVQQFDRAIMGGEYLYKGTNLDTILTKGDQYNVSNKNIIVNSFLKTKTNIDFSYKFSNDKDDDASIELPLLYYPGYVALDDLGNKLVVTRGNNNLLTIILPNSDQKNVHVYYRGKNSFFVGNAISLITVITVVIIWIRRKNVKIDIGLKNKMNWK